MTVTSTSAIDLVGGHVAVDFVNTVSWRLDDQRVIDRIADCQSLLDWSRRVRLIDSARYGALRTAAADDPGKAREAARRARRLRESLYLALEPRAADREPDPGDLAEFRDLLLDALGHAELAGVRPLRWKVAVRDLHDLPHLLAIRALELLESGDVTQLGQCQDDACGWLFVDRSRSRNRRWCSSADCGNRARARRHRTHRQGGHPRSDKE